MEAKLVSYAGGILKSAVGKLGTFLWNETLLLGNVRNDIQFIRDELQSMDGFLQDLVSTQHLNNQMRVWMLHVLELACDSELCIDDFADLLDGQHRRGLIKQSTCFVWNCWPRYKIAKMIQELKSRAKEVSERRSRYTTTIQTNTLSSASPHKDDDKMNEAQHMNNENKMNIAPWSIQFLAEDMLVGINHTSILEKLNPMYMRTGFMGNLSTARVNEPHGTTSTHTFATEIEGLDTESSKSSNVEIEKLDTESSKPCNVEIEESDTEFSKASNVEIEKLDTESSKPCNVELEELDTESSKSSNVEIEKLDTKSSKPCNVLAIVGHAGSGKTTLAKMLYRMRNVSQYNFSCAAWVTLSPDPDINMVLKAILRQIRKHSHPESDADEDEPKDILKEELSKQSRFLIILDSLRNESDWQEIKSVFADKDLDHGLIIVTTRSEDLAKVCCANKEELIHRMQPLSERQHEDLVGNLISLHTNSNFLKNEGKLALDYCCSVPLALKSLCGLLACAGMDIRTVNKVAMDVLDIMVQNLTREEKVLEVVQLCCSYLPLPLKQCLHDLISILPEGCAIKKKRLVRHWIAKGLALSSGAFSEEEVAEGYIAELTSRCIIEPGSVDASGKAKSYTINGVFRDTGLKQGYNQQTSIANPKCLQFYDSPIPSSLLENVREAVSLKSTTSLTVLDLEGCRGLRNSDLDNLPLFIKLKFLSLRNTDISRLPKKIGKLDLLETLDIRQTRVDIVPDGIVKFTHLKNFLAGHSWKPEQEPYQGNLNSLPKAVQVPEGIEGLMELETLATVNATEVSEVLHVVRDLKNLKKLGLLIDENKLNSKPLCISIMMLSESLRSLSVHDERQGRGQGSLEFLQYLCFPPQLLKSLNLKGCLGRLPQWIVDHRQLTKVTLSETKLNSNAIRSLGKVQNLQCLKLYTNSLKEHKLTFTKGEFLKLRLLVVYCNVIESIVFTKDAAPELEIFKWVFRKNQMGKLEGVENLVMLRQVSLIGNVSPIISDEINNAVKKHIEKHNKELILEKIDQQISEHNYGGLKENEGIAAKLKALSKKAQEVFQAPFCGKTY